LTVSAVPFELLLVLFRSKPFKSYSFSPNPCNKNNHPLHRGACRCRRIRGQSVISLKRPSRARNKERNHSILDLNTSTLSVSRRLLPLKVPPSGLPLTHCVRGTLTRNSFVVSCRSLHGCAEYP
jgi:hypothetical protein